MIKSQKDELKSKVLKLIGEGYTPDAVSFITNKRKDCIGTIIYSALLNEEVASGDPKIGILKKLPAELIKQFNELQDMGPYRVEKIDDRLIIMPW